MEHTHTDFYFNPFAGVGHEDIDHIIVPRPEMKQLIRQIREGKEIIVEFLGKKGRGKTTHLIWLSQHFPQYPLYLLNNGANKEALLQDPAEVLFIDSIHHLNFIERVRLFRRKKMLVCTTHWTRRLGASLARKPFSSIPFTGINPQILKEILDKRFQLASKDPIYSEIGLSESEIKKRIKKHGDNYRGILNELFTQYQNHEHTISDQN